MLVERELVAVRLPGQLLSHQLAVGRFGGHQLRLERSKSSRLLRLGGEKMAWRLGGHLGSLERRSSRLQRLGGQQLTWRLGRQWVLRILGGQKVARRFGGQRWVRRHRVSLQRSRLEPPGLGHPPGSVLLLLLQVREEAALGGSVLVGGAVPRGVGLVSSSSTLNKAVLQNRNLILVK